jgi:hypothetical protein
VNTLAMALLDPTARLLDPASTMRLATAAPAGAGAPADAGSLFIELLPWLIVLLAIAVGGGIVILWIRRSLKAQPDAPQGYTLEDLRRMHKAGELTDEEFTRAKETMLAKRPSREAMASKLVRPEPPDLRNLRRSKPPTTPPSAGDNDGGTDGRRKG